MFKIRFCLNGIMCSGVSTMNFLPRINETIILRREFYKVINIIYTFEDGQNFGTPVTIVANKIDRVDI